MPAGAIRMRSTASTRLKIDEARITNTSEHAALRKREVEIALGYIHSWPQRQCMCGYRDIKNFDRFNLIVQSIICLTVTKLKKIKELLDDLAVSTKIVNDSIAATASNCEKPPENVAKDESKDANEDESKKEPVVEKPVDKSSENVESSVITTTEPKPATSAPVKLNDDETYDKWALAEIEKLLIFISKVFLLNFPLYVAYKHGVHARLDEISPQEAQSLSLFCDLHDNEMPAFLLRNVSIFCNSGGFPAMMECFDQPNLPVSTAHAITAAISNLKLWLNYRSIIQQFVPLRIKVLQYMCKLSDQDLRSASTKSMADFMWAAIKDPLESQITFDTEGLALAFKYFTSSTLTMRLAGMSQINAHINLFNDIWSSETMVSDVEVVGQKLADWLTENQIIQHLFGPNLHVEVIKQSHIVLTFLAVENQITEEHITLIWQAAQLKHCSKPIYDILPALIKNLASRPAQHLYSLICRLDPKEHTKQSIYIASGLIKLIWTRDASRQLVNDVTNACLMQEVAELASSSENSVSVDGSNSEDEEEDEHPDDDDDSSDVGVGVHHHKSPLEIDGTSDSGAPPCKQARHKNCCDETSDDSIKVEPDIYDMKRRKKKALMCRMLEGSSSGDCLDDDVENYPVMRKKFRKKRKLKKIGPDGGSDGESDCEEESHSDVVTGVGEDSDDCSDANLQISAINQAITDGSIIEFLNAVENDGSCSSPMSAKSEKNMGDFEDEDDDPCDEELAELAARSACLAQFQIPRARQMHQMHQMQQLQMQRAMTPSLLVSKRHASSPIKVMSTKNDLLCGAKVQQHHSQMNLMLQSNRYSEICQPGNTLLWDLLQDDKIGLLSENLALEAERALGNLLCYTDKFIKMSFIEGCLQNLAANKTVIVSLRLLPRLLASFRDPDMNTHQVTMWAERNHKLMHHFFNNLKFYSNAHLKNQHHGLVLNHLGGLLYSHVQQIQVRLEFLSSIFSDMGSPRNFRLTLNQVDILWSSLGHDPDCADCLFAWLQGQTNAGDMHALGLNALQHLYLKKLPELRPEGISMVALGLFQQLFIKGRQELAKQALLANAVIPSGNEALDIVGMSNLWKIALRANNTDVSLAAIQYINTYYMEQQLKLESEFVSQCMNHLVQAADDLKRPGDQREHALMCVQRALMLLNTHLETFRRRYAYHLRRWALEGNAIGSHSALRSEGNGPPLRIILQPGGLPDKSILHLHTTDLVADLKAEIAKWWETLQGNVKTTGNNAPVLGFLLSEGPLRIITQGQEITSEYDERSLADVGFKDNQMVYVSLGGRGGGSSNSGGSGGRRKEQEYSSSLPAPSKDCLPTLLLLKSPYFEQLFCLMQTLGDMKAVGKGGHFQPHTKAQLLSRRVWDILAMLPTSPSFLETLKNLSFVDNADLDKSEDLKDNAIVRYSLQTILDPTNLQKFMYSLHIVETLCKSKFSSNCCNTNKSNVVTKASAGQAKTKTASGKSGSSNGKQTQQTNKKQSQTSNKMDVAESMAQPDEPMPEDGGEDKENEKIEEIHNPSNYDLNEESGHSKPQNGSSGGNNVILESSVVEPVADSSSKPTSNEQQQQQSTTADWNAMFVKCGGLTHLFSIFMSGVLQNIDEHDSNEWRHDCLASLLRILCLLGVEDMKPSDKVIVIPKLNDDMLKIMQVKSTLKRITSILDEASFPVNPNQFKTGFYGRAQIVHFSMNLLVCFAHSSCEARELIWTEPTKWLQRLILDDPEPAVRREACAALYRLCLGNAKTYPELMGPLLMRLVCFLAMAEKMTIPQSHNNYNSFTSSEEGKEPYGPACRDYFWLLCRLVDTLTPDLVKESLEDPANCTINIELLCRQVSLSILERDHLEARYNQQDDGLFGLLNLMGNLIKYDPPYKFSSDGQEFIDKIFDCLFALPSPQHREQPKCKSQSTRAAAYDLLVELCKSSPKNYILLHHRLMQQHRPGPHSPYPWDYWPRDDGRSDVGYVGLTNLGATCYMASCIQHIYMMPQARDAILSVPSEAPQKHKATLHELQRMFAYLMESERKSYNPRSFCRVYQMDHQPLNTGEQKDMAEFFIDLVSKLEEITPNLKNMVKRIFCGVLSNNVVSLDCGHVSRTLEEFYTVRCQVADMRNLHESLDEVTVKDTLEGDNMYTCSQCGRKVRAEKRACFKKLPQILCFNTMRYTFNMVTMLKEKVNTHFSFPLRLDMSRYVEKTLMPQHYQEEKRNAQLRRTGSRNTSESENPAGEATPAPEAPQKTPSTSSSVSYSCSSSSSSSESNNKENNGKDSPEGEPESNLQKKYDEEESEDFNEHYEYDLVGVTVHTGTADGGHYYSFIRERGNTTGQPDRWFLFNDAEVKIFDPSQIAAECFGGEMTSKTYDSVTEKYLDFSFEKTNSAYMLFYEWRSNRGGYEQRDQFDTPTTSASAAAANDLNLLHQKLKETQAKQQAMEVDATTASPTTSAPTTTATILAEDIASAKRMSDTIEAVINLSSSSAVAEKVASIETVSGVAAAEGGSENVDSLVRNKLETENKDIDNSIIKNTNLDIVKNKCDIEIKKSSSSTTTLLLTPSTTEPITVAATVKQPTASKSGSGKRASKIIKSSHRSLLSKELEDWIWQDNRHFLQDKNVFEHTYFNFMWQICGHIPQTLLMLPDVTCIAAQLSVSFFIETFIHAKEKPTMVLWVELLTKQFNASQEACEWFLRHMSNEPWWPVQVLIQCPNQMVRQMFQRLVIHVIQRLRSSHHQLYLKIETDDEAGNTKEEVGGASCVTKFIKSLILLMEHGAKAHLRHLSEFFGLLYEFSRMGEEESLFLLRINVIRSVADFYLGNKNQDCIDTCSDNDENSSDEALVADKTRPASLDKMIALVASLVERSRGPDLRIHLSTSDYNAIAGGKGFPFLYQQIKDNINPHQTRHLICALCRWDERLASQIIEMLFTAVTKHTELCGPFFKLLTLLTESSSGPSGLPCFSQLVLQRVWEAAEYCPQSALEWLAIQAPRNKIAHAWILQSAGNWVEQFLIAHHNIRVRNAAAYLLVSLVPSQPFRSNFRTTSHHKIAMHQPQRELTGEAQIILHAILQLLLRLLRVAKNYTEIQVHGTTKLTSYFTLMSYCMITKAEKLMLGPYLNQLWQLFHPRLSEPSVPAHHNKQALLAFWYHATIDCPENADLVATCPEITRNIAFNYILADHDDTEIVAYNRCMLPVYYGLLRLCCQQSKTLTRQLAAHQNLQWAFKNITPHPTQYPLAVDELFRLMTLFADRQQHTRDAATAVEIAAAAVEQREISLFRRNTLNAYLSGLDARVSWGTLIPALKILVDNDEDRLFVVLNGGIPMCFDALHTLHSMYHEATACHVAGDLQELLGEIILLVRIFTRSCGGSAAGTIGGGGGSNNPKAGGQQQQQQQGRPPSGVLKGLQEAVRRLLLLLNTFNPPEMRNLSLEVLKELVKCSSTVVISVLLPLLSHCHTQTNSHSLGPIGAYFPRRGAKTTWPPVSKTTPRPPRPMIQMNIPITQMIEKGSDREFDEALETFYRPYHDFLDVMFRMAVTTNQFDESLTTLSCLTGIEGGVLHFNLFPKFWVGIFNNKHTNRLSELLIANPLLPDYIDTILRDERMSLNDSIISNFIEIYYPKVKSRIQVPRLLETISLMLVNKKNLEDICGDLHAIRIIAQANGIPLSVKVTLQDNLHKVLLKFKEELMSEEESPAKKRKLDPIDTAAASDPTTETESKLSEEKLIDVTTAAASTSSADTKQLPVTVGGDPSIVTSSIDSNVTPMEDGQAIENLMDMSTPTTASSQDMNITFGSSVSPELSEHEIRKNLLKDIESHIEIIFECIDEDDEDTVVAAGKNIVRTGSVAAEAPGIAALLKNVQATATTKQATPTQQPPTSPMQVDTQQDVTPTTTNEESKREEKATVDKETMPDTNENKVELEKKEEPEVTK